MKKLLFATFVLTMVLPSMAMADACFVVTRNGDPELPTNEENALERACTMDGNCDVGTCGEPRCWWEYNARTRALDVQNISEGSCNHNGNQNPDSFFIWIDMIGLDVSGWSDFIEEPTGAVDEDGYMEVYLKRESRFQLEINNIPTPIQNQIDQNSHFVLNWADVCNWVINHSSGLTGAECP